MKTFFLQTQTKHMLTLYINWLKNIVEEVLEFYQLIIDTYVMPFNFIFFIKL
jgi:hypothetical protein